LENLLALNNIQDTIMAAGEKTIKIEDLGLEMFLNALPTSFTVMRSHLQQSDKEFDYQVVKKAMISDEVRLKVSSCCICWLCWKCQETVLPSCPSL
jgi:hypothetical protein